MSGNLSIVNIYLYIDKIVIAALSETVPMRGVRRSR